MNPYLKGFLVVLASAMVCAGGVATTTHDPWTIGIAVMVNVGTTVLGLVMPSPIPRKEWTDEERLAKIAAAATPQPKGTV